MGASQGNLFRSVVARGVGLAAIGMIIGLAVAAASSRWVASMLYKVPAADAHTFALAPLFLLAIALFATCIAAMRAMSINPVEALKAN